MVVSDGESSNSDQANKGWVAWIRMAGVQPRGQGSVTVTLPPAEPVLVEKSRKIAPVAPERHCFLRVRGGRTTWSVAIPHGGSGVVRLPPLAGAARTPPAAGRRSGNPPAVAARLRCRPPTRTSPSP